MVSGEQASRNDEIRLAYAREMRGLLARRLLPAWGLFFGMRATASILIVLYFPERLVPNVLLLLALSLTAAGDVLYVRRRPERAVPATVVACIAGTICHLVYFADVHLAVGESVVIIFMLFLTGLLILFPWGIRGQAWVSVSVVLGYLVLIAGGAHTALPPVFGVVGLSVAAVLTAVGAHVLDLHRFSAYEQAIRAERANARKTEFLSTVSHELRTPLNVIVGYTDLLLSELLTADQQDMLRRIRRQSVELHDLIQGMLNLDRLESGHGRQEVADVRIADLLDELHAELPLVWIKPEVQLRWEVASPDIVLRTRRPELEMILRNLIHNALKYTESGSVTVRAERGMDGRVDLTVSDTGPGIAGEELATIFEMFQQSRSNPARGGGVGLGLFIVKKLTEHLGGEVRVESRPGAGTRFIVSLPSFAPETQM
jgi:signal transduction histidine kinase